MGEKSGRIFSFWQIILVEIRFVQFFALLCLLVSFLASSSVPYVHAYTHARRSFFCLKNKERSAEGIDRRKSDGQIELSAYLLTTYLPACMDREHGNFCVVLVLLKLLPCLRWYGHVAGIHRGVDVPQDIHVAGDRLACDAGELK